MRTTLLALSALAAATPALAVAPTIEARLDAPAAQRIITRSGSWACQEDGCITRNAESRPAIMCELLAKEAGTIAAFSVDGAAFDEKRLSKCNKKAR